MINTESFMYYVFLENSYFIVIPAPQRGWKMFFSRLKKVTEKESKKESDDPDFLIMLSLIINVLQNKYNYGITIFVIPAYGNG